MDLVLEHNGEQITVDSESVKMPEGYRIVSDSDFVDRESVRKNYVPKAEFQRRLHGSVPKEEAHLDEDVVARVLSEHKDTPDIDTMKANMLRTEVEPREKRIRELEKMVVNTTIEAAAKGIFGDEFTTSPEPGIDSYVVTALSSRFKVIPGYGPVAVGPDGEPLQSNNATSANPYMGAREYVSTLKEQEAWKPYLREAPQNSGGSGRPKGGPGTAKPNLRRSTMSADQKIAFVKEHGKPEYDRLPE